MKQTIENQYMKLEIAQTGAEWKRLTRKADAAAASGDLPMSLELLWQGKPDIWPYSAPLCFPWCSRVDDELFQYKGKSYPAEIHGFIKHMCLAIAGQGQDHITYRLQWAADDTIWPWSFLFEISYRLKDKKIYCQCCITNTGIEDMPVQMGFHTGFACPFVPDTTLVDYAILFECEEPTLGAKQLDLTKHMFDDGRILFYKLQSTWIALLEKNSGCRITVDVHDFPYVLLWSKPGIPDFVCIEPWSGSYGSGHELFDRPGTIRLSGGMRKQLTQIVEIP